MAHRPRAEMIAETRAKLIAAGRKAFARTGYADASMDEFVAQAGLTRGALYHHFGGKAGLLAAVIEQIDGEMTARLKVIGAAAPTRWEGFVAENVGYLKMALDPEIQRIVLRDGPAVLGDPSSWPSSLNCVSMVAANLEALQKAGVVREIDPLAAAWMITGGSVYMAQSIGTSDDPQAALERAIPAFQTMLEGLLIER